MATLRDRDWEMLLRRIKDRRCTPIIGDGALGFAALHRANIAAQHWSKQYNYPFADVSDLAKVAQFVAALMRDSLFPKEDIARLVYQSPPHDPHVSDDVHNILAEMPFPVYITTNYDDTMTLALKARNKTPRREICRWNRALQTESSVFYDVSGFEPDVANPVVYHLYGHIDRPESLVLNRDDYFRYLANISANIDAALPARIRHALAEPSLLFLGCCLDTLAFRVLYRGIVGVVSRPVGRSSNVFVTLPPDFEGSTEYLENYLGLRGGVIHWAMPAEFAVELRERWRDYTE